MAREGAYFHTRLWAGVFRTRNWLVIGFGMAAVVLGLWGFYECDAAACRTQSFGEKLFRTIDLIRLTSRYTPENAPWPLVIAQLMMPLALVMGALRLFILNMRRDLKVVMVRRMRGHMIVCGLGDTGLHIAQHLADAGHKVVAISRDNQDVNALACERRGIVVLQGDGMEMALMRLAGLRHAARLFVACGSDATNIEIGLRADAAIAKPDGGTALKIWVELRNEWLYNQILTHRKRVNTAGAGQFRLFNLNANAARLLLRSEGFRQAAARAALEHPHVLIAGHGQTLHEIIVQLAECHFAIPGRRLAVTLISDKAQSVLNSLLAKYPGLSDCVDIAVQDCAFDEDGVWPAVKKIVAQTPPFAVIADLGAEVATMKAALGLRKILDAADQGDIPIYMRVWQQHELSAFLQGMEKADSQPDRLAVFGDLQALTSLDHLLEESLDLLAGAAHNVYSGSAAASGAAPVLDWDALSEQAKQSNRAFADHIPVKLAQLGLKLAPAGTAMGLSDDEIETLAQIEHWRWSQALKIRGWRLGARNELRKTHPLLKPWEELDPHDQEINREMVRRIPAIARAARLALVCAESGHGRGQPGAKHVA